MSFSTFKSNMLSYMQNQESINSSDDFATKLTNEYDLCIKRGFQSTIDAVPLSKGNKSGMESLVKVACKIALLKQSGNHTFIDDIGKGVVVYWVGASLAAPMPPITPAIGAIQNISTTSIPVTSPGAWAPIGPIPPPNTDSNIFLDLLITSMKIHLTTIIGTYMTLSLYPTFPPTPPAPGMLPFVGYVVSG